MSVVNGDHHQPLPNPAVISVIEEGRVYAPQPSHNPSYLSSRNASYSERLPPPVTVDLDSPVRRNSSMSSLNRPHYVAPGEGNAVVPSEAGIERAQSTRRREKLLQRLHHHPRPGAGGGTGVIPDEDADLHDHYEEHYSNFLFSTRSYMRVYFAEFVGTMILVLWGEGTQAQVLAARKEPGDYLSIAWGWGIGFMLAIYVSSGISGGHINPAVTVSLAVFRKFPWKKVPGYIAAQLLGGFAAAAIIYGIYYGPLNAVEGGYASIMTTGPAGAFTSVASIVFSVFIGSALLMGSICAFTDTANNPATPGLTPLLLGLVMVGIASSFGFQTGFVLNPARDLGPRLLVWAVGAREGTGLWLGNHAYGIWIPTVGSISGALGGNLVYDFFIYSGRDSPLNANFSLHAARERRHRKKRDLENLHEDPQEYSAGDHRGAAPVEPRISDSTLHDGEVQHDREKHGKPFGFGKKH